MLLLPPYRTVAHDFFLDIPAFKRIRDVGTRMLKYCSEKPAALNRNGERGTSGLRGHLV